MTTTQKHNVPAQQFPEFAGEWEDKKLGEFFTFKNGVNADKSKYGFGHKFINVLDIIADYPITSNSIIGRVSISDIEFKKNEVVFGDILFQRSSETREEVGQSNVYLDKKQSATFGGFVIRGRPVAKLNSEFFDYLLKTEKVRKDITSRSGGSTRYNIGQGALAAVLVTLPPSLLEQQKIASFLTSVEAKIKQISKRKSLLEQYKKGMRQKLFRQELRFKDEQGNDFPDWDKKKLEELIKNIGGTALEKYTDPFSKYKFISIGNYSIDGKYIDNGQRVKLNEKTKTKLLEKGNLVMVLNDKTASGDIIGSTILIEVGDTYIYNQRSERIICNSNVLPQYLWQYLNSTMFRTQVFRMAQGGTQIYVNFPVVKTIELLLPRLGEQQKIVDFFSAIDQKIDFVGTELNQAKAFKKGLLQQMFI